MVTEAALKLSNAHFTDVQAPGCAPAYFSTMAATMSLKTINRGAMRSSPAARRSAVRVQAFQVTMQTPSGCKKFEQSADKNLLEVRAMKHASCSTLRQSAIMPFVCSIERFANAAAAVHLPHRVLWQRVLRSPICAGQAHVVRVLPGWFLVTLSAATSSLMTSRRRQASCCSAPQLSRLMWRSSQTRRRSCIPCLMAFEAQQLAIVLYQTSEATSWSVSAKAMMHGFTANICFCASSSCQWHAGRNAASLTITQ